MVIFFNQTNIQSKFKDILIKVNADNQEYLSSFINNIIITLLIATCIMSFTLNLIV